MPLSRTEDHFKPEGQYEKATFPEGQEQKTIFNQKATFN